MASKDTSSSTLLSTSPAAAAAAESICTDDWIEECLLCAEICTDPRTLPCKHGYCFDCIQDLCNGGTSGGHVTVTCPLCGKGFNQSDCSPCDLPKMSFSPHQCCDCAAATCTSSLCNFVGGHVSHTTVGLPPGQDIADLRRQMADDVEDLVGTIENCRKVLKEVINSRDKFTRAIDRIEKELAEKTEAEDDREEINQQNRSRSPRSKSRRLLNDLRSIKAKRMNEVGAVMIDIDRHIALVDRLKKRAQVITTNGTDVCLTRESVALHDGTLRLKDVKHLRRVAKKLDQFLDEDISTVIRLLQREKTQDNLVDRVFTDFNKEDS